MINRRTFTTLLAGMADTAVVPRCTWSQTAMPKTILYTSVGPEVTLFDLGIVDAGLGKRGTVTLPANMGPGKPARAAARLGSWKRWHRC